ncbi:MAG: thiamine-phosphate kinase [Betaproteobacteria bacterium RIFCSPLOWO2_02_FULL_67_26]|nr:MAG: thiamine-phosphate kinase [Betaproteobacteria bacterium RIFCSPLOWO2_02_FULL_67_26]
MTSDGQVAALSEFEIIRRYFTRRAHGAVLGVGDDAAIVRARRGWELVVTTDMLVAGRHFRADADPEKLGHKALAVNLSDLAAMGATPRWATLALALPRADARWLAAFSRGFMRLARRHGVDLIGGDTTRGPLNITVQAMGEVPAGAALRRDGARVGDDIWVSGALGDAALALSARRLSLTRGERARAGERLDVPTPRIALGEGLRGVARSAIDVSDGLIADLGHICERSRVASVVDLNRIPASAVVKRHLQRAAARQALLAGGDDYELVFTAGRARRAAIRRLSRRLRLKLTLIGSITRRRGSGTPVTVLDPAGRPIVTGRKGYEHF